MTKQANPVFVFAAAANASVTAAVTVAANYTAKGQLTAAAKKNPAAVLADHIKATAAAEATAAAGKGAVWLYFKDAAAAIGCAAVAAALKAERAALVGDIKPADRSATMARQAKALANYASRAEAAAKFGLEIGADMTQKELDQAIKAANAAANPAAESETVGGSNPVNPAADENQAALVAALVAAAAAIRQGKAALNVLDAAADLAAALAERAKVDQAAAAAVANVAAM